MNGLCACIEFLVPAGETGEQVSALKSTYPSNSLDTWCTPTTTSVTDTLTFVPVCKVRQKGWVLGCLGLRWSR